MKGLLPDEPTVDDHLGYEVYADGLLDIVTTCETPLTIGIHGRWGTGKTSLMQMIRRALDGRNSKQKMIRTVWFNPWQFQFEESAIIPLLHAIREEAVTGNWVPVSRLKNTKIFSILGSLAGEAVLRATTGGTVSMESILQQGLAFEEKYFETKTIAQRLRENFSAALAALVDKAKGSRLVIFIDDLDRCLPEFVLKTLESIKLFLNVPKCVFVVALDPAVVQRAIANRYGEGSDRDTKDYLDKIIQLPFFIPPMPDGRIEGFVRFLSSDRDLQKYLRIVIEGVERNPRHVKRFLNSFVLHDLLANRIGIDNYDKQVLAKLLVVQFRWPVFLENFSVLLEVEQVVVEGDESSKNKLFEREKAILSQVDIGNLTSFLGQEPFLGTVENIHDYVSMSRLGAPITPSRPVRETRLSAVELRERIQAGGDLRGTNLMDLELAGVDLTGADLRGANLVGTNLRDAILVGCDFTGANLERAVLDGANVKAARFEKVNFWRSSLAGMKNVEKAISWEYANLWNTIGLSQEDRTVMSNFKLLNLGDYVEYFYFYETDLKMSKSDIKNIFKWVEHEYFKFVLSPPAGTKDNRAEYLKKLRSQRNRAEQQDSPDED